MEVSAKVQSISEALLHCAEWTREEMIDSLIGKGYSSEESARTADCALWKLGRLRLEVPEVPGWRFVQPHWPVHHPMILVYEQRDRYRFYSLDGTRVGKAGNMAEMVGLRDLVSASARTLPVPPSS